jgi:hypothetical protein
MVEEIITSHQTYQTLILESGAESYEFVPGRAITGATGASNNSALFIVGNHLNVDWLLVSNKLLLDQVYFVYNLMKLVSLHKTTQQVQTQVSALTKQQQELV